MGLSHSKDREDSKHKSKEKNEGEEENKDEDETSNQHEKLQEAESIDSVKYDEEKLHKKIRFQKNSFEYFEISLNEIRQLQRIYRDETAARGPKHPGDEIFQHINQRLPLTKAVYETKQEADDQAPDYGYHHEKITEIMDFVMANLEHPKKIRALLRKTGAAHLEFKKHGFQSNFWNSLGDAMLHCSLSWGHGRQTTKQRDAWFNLFVYICDELKTGYLTALHEMRRRQAQAHASAPHSDTHARHKHPAVAATADHYRPRRTSLHEAVILPDAAGTAVINTAQRWSSIHNV